MKKITSFLIALLLALPVFAAQGFNDLERPFNRQASVPVAFDRIGGLLQYQNFEGEIRFESSGGASFGLQSLSPFAAADRSTPYSLNFFSTPLTAFSLEFGDNEPDEDQLILRAYSDYHGRGRLLGEVRATLSQSRSFTSKKLTVEADGIRSVTFIGGSAARPNSVFYDNFRASSKPVRASFNDEVYSYADFAVVRGSVLYSVRFAGQPVYNFINLGDTGKVVTGDYDGDNLSEAAVFNNGLWTIRQASGIPHIILNFGSAGDIPVSADFDGDGKTDIAVFRPSNGTWYVFKSSDKTAQAVRFGAEGDIPVAANYDGDGRADVAVFRPSDGTWYILGTKNGFRAERFGLGTDQPVPADYDADGITDIAVFRDGYWYLNKSTEGFEAVQFGSSSDVPVPNDYFADLPLQYSVRKDEIAVFRPETGTWYVRTPDGFSARQWGAAGDKPVSLAPIK